ncbi:MAG TPA: hypothetical protein VGQ06_09000 [Gemmatimonadales bacterium]|nr:hypothetical protein [Gemmatimonadales bacterium]
MRFAPLLVALAAALPRPVIAQEPADTTPHSSGPRFYVAGGFELGRLIRFPSSYAGGYGPSLGLSLQGGYIRQFDRLGLRLGVAYYEREREYRSSFPDFSLMSDSRTVAANVDLTYDLTRSRVRPYVIGGLTFYRASVSSRYDNGTRVDYHPFGGALTPGVGLRFPLRNAEAFTEARFHLFSGHSEVILPFTFGIRF